MHERSIPRATYRLQLRPEFDFDAAAATVAYLDRLGISHLYCSPYLQAAPGSSHGYDVVDFGCLNAELGGAEGLHRLRDALQQRGMGQVLDVVANHMAIDQRTNRWWWDVLQDGPASPYARCFDIDWWGDDKEGPSVLVPVLGSHYGRVLEAGEIDVSREGGTFVVRYYDHTLPLSPKSSATLLERAAAGCSSPELEALGREHRALSAVPPGSGVRAQDLQERHARKQGLQRRLGDLAERDEGVARALHRELEALRRDPEALDGLLRQQRYRLAYWRTANEEVDYRRFFNIETLVGLRVEDPFVFHETHRLVLQLVREGGVQGLRIDHIDGLRDPRGYLARLREEVGGTFLLVEKILELDEALPASWPVDGTTGYEFIASVSNLLVAEANEEALDRCYARFVGEAIDYEETVHVAKRRVMNDVLRAEIDRLVRLLSLLCETYRRHRDHTERELRDALMEFLAAFPVYRTYVQPDEPVSEADRRWVRAAVDATLQRRPDIDGELVRWLGSLALLEEPGETETAFALRLAQASAPVMAKGVEDTAFYRFQRLISLNEVGGDPGCFGRAVEVFHARMARAAERQPRSMLTLSTHDTKRSADVRARLHLLSELPEAWEQACTRFRRAAAPHRTDPWPDAGTEYMLYQTLVGAWPLEGERVAAFLHKATREAKLHTSWVHPNPEYEAAVVDFAKDLLDSPAFVGALEEFLEAHRLVELGRVNALIQTTLLLTCPGIPDLYQGTELWDLSLVDPDNRRAVDYTKRARRLAELDSGCPLPPLREDEEGLHKLRLVSALLRHRRAHPEIYAAGGYTPLRPQGERAGHAVAFSRGALVVVVPRLVTGLADGWGDTRLQLPEGSWRELFTNTPRQGCVELESLLEGFPVSVLERSRD